MTLTLLIVWIAAITCFTLLGSWYARKYQRADLLIALYVTFTLAAQVLAVKIASFNLGGHEFTAPAGVLVFSITFLLTDIVNEKFGRAETQRMILIALVSQVAASAFFYLGVKLAPAPFWPGQASWQMFFGLVPRIMVASWVAFFVSENADAYIFSAFKNKTGGKHLWARNVFSSIPALALDSLVFVPLAFFGLLPIWPLIVGQVAIKWLVGIINVPFMYLNKSILKD